MAEKTDKKRDTSNSVLSHQDSLKGGIDVERKKESTNSLSSQGKKTEESPTIFSQDSLKGIVDVKRTKEAFENLFSNVDIKSRNKSETSEESQQVSKTDSTLPQESTKEKSKWYVICIWIKNCELECLLLLYGVMMTLMQTFVDNIIYNKMCAQKMGKEYTRCFNFEDEVNVTIYELKVYDVLKDATSHKTGILVIKLPIMFASSMFLCSWSDLYGRKLPLIVSILCWNIMLLNYYFLNSDYVSFLTALYSTTVISSIFGGTVCINAMSYSYGTDHSSVGFRTLKFVIMDVSFVIGTIAGSLILRNFPNTIGLLENLLFSIFASVISVTWIFFLFEDKPFEGKDKTKFVKVTDLFSTSNVRSSFKVLTRWRSNCEAEQLRMIVLSTMSSYIYYGFAEGPFLSNSKHASYFSATKDYNLFMNGFNLYSCASELLVMIFIQYCVGLEDSTIGLIGFFSLFLPCFLTAFASDVNILILASTIAAVKSFPSIALRSTVSKISDDNENGRTFLFVSFAEITAMYMGRIWHEKRYFLIGQRAYPDFSFLLECTVLVIPFCFFMFQVISIHTEDLYRKCYTTVRVPLQAVQPRPQDDNSDIFDA